MTRPSARSDNSEDGRPAIRNSYKRPFDLSFLLLAHLLFVPLWLLLWIFIPIAIWLGDRGPVFYKQRRAGKNGQAFTVYKFRTMVPHADLQGPAWTTEGDHRLTRVGRVLRRTAFDELPEIWNILKGDMSLVGPRALEVTEQQSLEKLIVGFEDRLEVQPGLTGLAQIYDSRDDAHDKFNYDLEYLQRMSPWLDVKLLILSVRNTLAIKWDRRIGKMSDAKEIPDSVFRGDRQLETARDDHVESNSGSELPGKSN